MAEDEDAHHGHGSTRLRHGADQPRATHDDAPAGLTVAANGLVLVADETTIEPGEELEWRFEIQDERGDAVTAFDELHGEPLHLIVVRRDLAGFQHLHPAMAPDGTWSQSLVLLGSGVYRAFVDVSVGGESTTLGVDLFAPGEMDVDVEPDFVRTRRIGDYEVSLSPDAADETAVTPGHETTLTFEVEGDGGHPAALEPYLEAHGHLVALREGDLAYLHVHPIGSDPEVGRVSFRTAFPTRGRYRLFLQVRPDGDLVTTWFDVLVDETRPSDR